MTTTSQIYDDVSVTGSAREVRAVIGAAQQELLRTVRAHAALLELELDHDARETAWEHLVRFCANAVRGYLRACEQTLYTAAGRPAASRLLVDGLRVTAGLIDRQIEALAEAEEPVAVSAAAEAVEALLAAHLAVEHDVLLPALTGASGLDLPELTARFRLLHADAAQTPA